MAKPAKPSPEIDPRTLTDKQLAAILTGFAAGLDLSPRGAEERLVSRVLSEAAVRLMGDH